MEVLKTYESFVDILAIFAAATLIEEHVDLFADREEYFCREVCDDGDSVLVVNTVLSYFFDEENELDC